MPPIQIVVSCGHQVTIESCGNPDVKHTIITGRTTFPQSHHSGKETFHLTGKEHDQGLTYIVQKYENVHPQVDYDQGVGIQRFRSTSFKKLKVNPVSGWATVYVEANGATTRHVVNTNEAAIITPGDNEVLNPPIAKYNSGSERSRERVSLSAT
jgi:hypothetical protein